jgi:S1-C subfamily serine protease
VSTQGPAPTAPGRRRPWRLALLAACAALLGAAALAGILLATGALDDEPQAAGPTGAEVVRLYDDRIADVVQASFGSVANVDATLAGGEESVGTGIVVDADGLVLTNQHVVDDAEAVAVAVAVEPGNVPAGAEVVAEAPPGAEGGATIVRVAGSVVASDPELDLAIVEVPVTGLRPIAVGDPAGLRLGQGVIAIGFALSLTGGPSVTSGIVAGIGRTVTAEDGTVYSSLIQTDTAINRGNSGGPLLDTSGRLVGIASLVAPAGSAEDIGFAIPADRAADLIEQARAD